jgi:hypothetical protein
VSFTRPPPDAFNPSVDAVPLNDFAPWFGVPVNRVAA